jgi:hypothetical protein
MKKIAVWVVCAGFYMSIYATDARVITLGGNDNFFMDDFSIFRNPANINYYPNMLLGSPGTYNMAKSDTSNDSLAGLRRKNTDPQNPYFGPILSYSLNQSSESGNQYPLLSLAVILNRYDNMLDYLNPEAPSHKLWGVFPKLKRDSVAFATADPVGKIDVMLGYGMQNGMLIGVGGYFAFQRGDSLGTTLESGLYRGNIGINWPIAKSMNLEISAGITSIKGTGYVSSLTPASRGIKIIADNNVSVRGDIRLFSALTTLNGDFVPHLSIENINLNNYSEMNVAGGLGVNINIDKGFFWAGLEGLYEATTYKSVTSRGGDSIPSGIGARISAGLERNVIFDWWVWRIGVSKKLLYMTDGNNEKGHWVQNPEADGSDGDEFALGWGLNIENRLKVDVVIAEDMFYTWTNFISGAAHHLANRITATYSF